MGARSLDDLVDGMLNTTNQLVWHSFYTSNNVLLTFDLRMWTCPRCCAGKWTQWLRTDRPGRYSWAYWSPAAGRCPPGSSGWTRDLPHSHFAPAEPLCQGQIIISSSLLLSQYTNYIQIDRQKVYEIYRDESSQHKYDKKNSESAEKKLVLNPLSPSVSLKRRKNVTWFPSVSLRSQNNQLWVPRVHYRSHCFSAAQPRVSPSVDAKCLLTVGTNDVMIHSVLCWQQPIKIHLLWSTESNYVDKLC